MSTYSVNLWSITADAAVASIPVAAPIILWTDEVTALSTAPCSDNYTDCRRTWSRRSLTPIGPRTALSIPRKGVIAPMISFHVVVGGGSV